MGKITFWSITLLLALNLFLINLSPDKYKRYIDYKNNAVIFEYPRDNYEGIEIPKDVRLFFVKNVDSINEDWLDFFNINKWRHFGTYNILNKEIKILWDNRNNEDIKSTLIHELAHYTYYNNLTNYQKERIKIKYEYFCRNEREIYAEIIEDYGYFNYD